MFPTSNGCSSVAWCAGSAPRRLRMLGSTLVPEGGTWRTTKTTAGRSPRRFATSRVSASTPPAEAPTTTMSRPECSTTSQYPPRTSGNVADFPDPLAGSSGLLRPAEPEPRPHRERDGRGHGDPEPRGHVFRLALEQAPYAGEHERDGIGRRHGVDPAVEQRERDVHRREEEHHEDGRLHQRPRLHRAEAEGDPARPEDPADVRDQGEPVDAEEVDPAAADLHVREQRHDREQRRDADPAEERAERVADDDPAASRRGDEEPASEAPLEVSRDPESGEDAAEARRLQEHEHELE